jgi:alpha-beta hydrolase superfamily lysophospholipase
MGHEYIVSHRAYQKLAVRLSQAGFPVLRFDFHGCGDSAGDGRQDHLGQWLDDIAGAIDEIRGRAHVAKVCLVGLRLGASLAILAGAQRGDVDGIVLWDPVVSGKPYVEQLTQMHLETVQHAHAPARGASVKERPTEILGFPLTNSLFADLIKLDLLAIQRKPANNMLVIISDPGADGGRVTERFKSTAARVEFQRLPGSPLWMEDVNKVLVPGRILDSVVAWMSRVYP